MTRKTILSTTASFLLALSPAFAAWSTYHGDAQRTGSTPMTLSANLSVGWTLDLPGPIVVSPVIGASGVVYVGTVQEDASLHPRAVLVAVSPTGTVLWTFATRMVDHDFGNVSTPAIGPDGTVYFGAPDGAFYAVASNGVQRWKHQGVRPAIQTPVVAADGSIYTGMDGKLVKFSPQGVKLWERQAGDPRQPGGPTLGRNGTVYVNGTSGGRGAVHAYSPAGVLRWTFASSEYFHPLAPPTVAPDGTILSVSDNVYGIRPDGTVKFMSQPTYAPNGYASVAVDPAGFIYLSAYVYVFKLDSMGNTVWEHVLEEGNRLGSSYGSIVVDGQGNLFTGLGTGKQWAIPLERRLLVLSPAGDEIGGVPLVEVAATSSPAVAADGTLYIGTLAGRLYALRP